MVRDAGLHDLLCGYEILPTQPLQQVVPWTAALTSTAWGGYAIMSTVCEQDPLLVVSCEVTSFE